MTGAELAKPRSYAATLADWMQTSGGKVDTLAAAAQGDLIINASTGAASIDALTQAGAAHLAGKVLIDVANPLDASRGFPPVLTAACTGHTSLAEAIQTAFPNTKVVKVFNTIAAAIMVNPGLIKTDHDLFIAGNDAPGKAQVSDIARSFGWTHIVDLGDISGARASKALLPIWLRLMVTTGRPMHNLPVAQG